MAAAAVLNFEQGPFWAPDSARVANMKLQTQFGSNHSRNGRDNCSCISKIATPAILNFARSGIFGQSYPRVANIYMITRSNANTY